MNEINKCKTYLKSRRDWFGEKFGNVIKNDDKNYVFERRVKQAYRDCNIVLRRVELLEKKHPEGIPPDNVNEIIALYKNFRFETIPKLYNLIETLGK